MKLSGRLSLLLLLSASTLAPAQQALPQPLKPPTLLRWGTRNELVRLNRNIAGQILDFTANHGADNRIHSPALGTRRDLYVYLPPGYNPANRYPLMIWLHGILQDDDSFLDIAHYWDDAMAAGTLPPFIIAAPDGSIRGRASINGGSFYLNSEAGRFGDYISEDVWGFVTANFPVRPEREAHVLAGASMGGFGAYNIAIRHRDRFGVAVGFMPTLNLRYSDCRGRYFGPFDPGCNVLREAYRPHMVVGKFYGGLVCIRQKRFVEPIHGRGPGIMDHLSRENPVEMLDTHGVKPGELAMWVACGTRDQFNLLAQCHSFVHAAEQRGIEVTLETTPGGKHNSASAARAFPALVEWLSPRLAPYAPAAVVHGPRVAPGRRRGLGLFPILGR